MPLQDTVPSGQPHVPAMQISSARQVMPQPPQFFGSVSRSVHRSSVSGPQEVCPGGQAHPAMPQISSSRQRLPQKRQLLRSVSVLVHLPAQQTSKIDYRANLAGYPLTSHHDTTIPGSELLAPGSFSAGHNPLVLGTPAAFKNAGPAAFRFTRCMFQVMVASAVVSS